jgi:DNA replication protein DnaC
MTPVEIFERDGYEFARVPIEDQLRWAGVPLRFRDVTWDRILSEWSFPEEIREQLTDFSEWFPCEGDSSVVLFGPQGRGKTTYAAATTRRFLGRFLAKRPKWVEWPRLVADVADSWKDGGEARVLDPLIRSSFLVIDDFGKEVAGPADSMMAGWQRRVAFEIINGRYSRVLPTLITTELTSDEMGDRLDPAITSRLLGDGRWIDLSSAPDYRLGGE